MASKKTTVETSHKKYLLRSFTVEVVREASEADPRTRLTSSEEVARVVRSFIPDDEREHFGIFLLDNKNRLIKHGYHEVSVGTLTASLVHPREVFKPILLAGAAAFVCVHNHPSGDPTPSTEDIDITRRLFQCAEIFGIRLLDHVIVGNGSDRYYSFNDRGQL